jgi:DNA polymerase-3 subunit delta
MNEAVSELKKIVLGASVDFNFSLFYGDSASAREIVETAETYPMLSRRRLVVVKNAESLPEGELKSLESYLSSPSPTTCLVLIFEEEKKRYFSRSVGEIAIKENKRQVVFVHFVLDTKDISETIKQEARKLGCEITKEAAQTLLSLVGENLKDIHVELEKLALFVGNKNKIKAEDVEKLTEKTRFEDVFQLVNAIAEKDKKKVLRILLELESKNEEPLVILNNISSRFRLIWKAKELIDQKVPQDAILKELRISSRYLYYIRQQANNSSYEDIKRINRILYEGDRTLKTTYIPRNLSLTKLVLDLCG